MPDNLAVNIEIAVKNKTELDLTASKIRGLQRDIKKLADEGNKDPMAIPKLKAANAELLKLNKTVVDLQKTMHRGKEESEGLFESIAHSAHGNRPIVRLLREFGNLGGGIENTLGILGRFVGGFTGGIVGIAAAKAWDVISEKIDETSKKLTEFKNLGAEIGVKPIAAQAAGEISRGIGEDAQAGIDFMKAMGAEIEKARQAAGQPLGVAGRQGPAARAQPRVLRGSDAPEQFTAGAGHVVQTLRGGQEAASDLNKVWEQLTKTVTAFPSSTEGTLQTMLQFNRNLVELSKVADPQRFNLFTKGHGFGPGETALKEAEAQIVTLEKQIADLQNKSHAATDKNISDNDRLIASQNKLGDAVEESWSKLTGGTVNSRIAINEFLADLIDTYDKFEADLRGGWANNAEAFKLAFIDPVLAAWSPFLDSLTSAWDVFSGNLITAAKNAASAISSMWNAPAPSSIFTPVAAPGMASGGFVRGPGSGTSDSILARLSAGEFVVNSASVRRLGTSFLSGLNGFATGGLVGIPRFAGGGLVSAGGGTPVHLHLGGQSFALSGHDNVVSALVSEAARQQTRSAGVKPSWFGGRAGGH
jgi:polyhydroxyalkanoate synthesis regulator phasin